MVNREEASGLGETGPARHCRRTPPLLRRERIGNQVLGSETNLCAGNNCWCIKPYGLR